MVSRRCEDLQEVGAATPGKARKARAESSRRAPRRRFEARREAVIVGGYRMNAWTWPRVYRGFLYRGAPMNRTASGGWHISWETAERRWRCVFAQAGARRVYIGWRVK